MRDLRSGYNNNWLVLSNPDEGGEWVSTATIADGLTDFVLSNMQLLKWTPRHRHLTAEKQKKTVEAMYNRRENTSGLFDSGVILTLTRFHSGVLPHAGSGVLRL